MQAMASLLFSSSPAPTSTPLLRFPSTPFKGTLFSLHPFKLSQRRLQSSRRPLILRAAAAAMVTAPSAPLSRFRLDNLAPQPGSRKRNKRKGRGIAAGQGNSCGFGMRGQKSRSGPGVRKGFEGGQMPLYRRIPKLRGIAGDLGSSSWSTRSFTTVKLLGPCSSASYRCAVSISACNSKQELSTFGMHAGLPKYVPVNIKDIESAGFEDGDEISLETLKSRGLLNPSGRERSLPLKILGDGDLSVKLNIKARAFSAAAKEKLEAAGCTLTVLPGRRKWVKPAVAKNLARAEEYFAKKKSETSSG